MFKNITRTVWIISLVSLFNDFSSEMLYPIMPLYLAQIGYGGLLIGIIEGIAELIAGFTKIYTGSLSDNLQRRLPFINVGYGLSVLSRPLIIISQSWIPVIVGRSIDKVGKGIRTGARDALLAQECNVENRGEVFGFHRSMDTIGAILGPIAAMIYLHFYPEDYFSIFLITIIPGVIAFSLTFFIKEEINKNEIKEKANFSLKKNFSFYKIAPKPYLIFLCFVFIFSLINSSDMLLLLKAKETGMHESRVLMMYILFNITFALFAFPIGKLADKFNKEIMVAIGLLLYACTYLLITFFNSEIFMYAAFAIYGLYYACTQGLIKAILIEKAGTANKSNAVGFFEGINSIFLLLANIIAGLIWYLFGSNVVMIYSGIGALLVAISIFIYYKK